MTCCLNPDCLVPVNPPEVTVCQSCGNPLTALLRNRYHPVKPLGQGGFGKTYLAEDIDRLNTRCVIKQFVRQASNKTFDKALELFNQEAVRLNDLGEHQQIPALLAYFELEGNFYLVQQIIDGKTLLQEVKQDGPFNEDKIRNLLNHLLPVLQFIHENNVVHRDINPTNIICREQDNKPVLIDFGIAKQLEASLMDEDPHTGTRIGTEGYSPIEQLRSGEAYPSSDLYSLGATCICLLTGRKPEKLYNPLEGRWLWQEQLIATNRAVTPELAAILDRMLKDFINDRYRTAAEVLQDLEALPAAHRSVPGWTRRQPEDDSPMSDAISSSQDASRTLNQHLINQEISAEFGQAHTPTAPPDRQSGMRQSGMRPAPPPGPISSGPISRARSSGPMSQGKARTTGPSEQLSKSPQKPSGPLSGKQSGPRSGGHTGARSGRTSGPVSGKIAGSTSQPSTPVSGKLSGSPTSLGKTGQSRARVSASFGSSSGPLSSGINSTRVQISGLRSGSSRWVCTHTLEGHSSWVSAVAFSPKYRILASGGLDDTIHLWDIANGNLILSLKGHTKGINGLAFSPQGQILVSCSNDDTIRVWHVGTGKLLHVLKDHRHDVTSVAVGSRSTLVSSSVDCTVGIWNLEQGKLIKGLSGGNTGMLRCVDITPDEELVVSGGFDNKIRIWQVQSGEVFRVLSGHVNSVNDVSISTDSRLIASAGKDRCIKLWSLRSGNLIHTLKGHTGEVNAVAIEPNQRTVISAGGDSSIKIWDTKTGELLDTFSEHGNSVTAIAIHPNGQFMASASSDKTIKLWQKE